MASIGDTMHHHDPSPRPSVRTRHGSDTRGLLSGIQVGLVKKIMVGNYQEIARKVKFSVITSRSTVRGRDSSQTPPGSTKEHTGSPGKCNITTETTKQRPLIQRTTTDRSTTHERRAIIGCLVQRTSIFGPRAQKAPVERSLGGAGGGILIRPLDERHRVARSLALSAGGWVGWLGGREIGIL